MTHRTTHADFAARLAAMADMRDMTDDEVGRVLGMTRAAICNLRRRHRDVEWTGKRRVVKPGWGRASTAHVSVAPVKPRKAGVTLAKAPWERQAAESK